MIEPTLPFPEDEGISFLQSYDKPPVTDDPYQKGVQIWFWNDFPDELKKYIKYQEHIGMVALLTPWFDYYHTVMWLERLGAWHTRHYPCPEGVLYVGYEKRQPHEEYNHEDS